MDVILRAGEGGMKDLQSEECLDVVDESYPPACGEDNPVDAGAGAMRPVRSLGGLTPSSG
jgi:hypothetical protein